MKKFRHLFLSTLLPVSFVYGCTNQQSAILPLQPTQDQTQASNQQMKVFDKIAVDKDELITFTEFKLLGIFGAGSLNSTRIDVVEQNLDPMQKKTFDSLDLNKDGKLTRDEFSPLEKTLSALTINDIFNKIAVDKDGLITTDEFMLLGVFGVEGTLRDEGDLNTMLNQSFKTLDKNKDGKLNLDEFKSLKI